MDDADTGPPPDPNRDPRGYGDWLDARAEALTRALADRGVRDREVSELRGLVRLAVDHGRAAAASAVGAAMEAALKAHAHARPDAEGNKTAVCKALGFGEDSWPVILRRKREGVVLVRASPGPGKLPRYRVWVLDWDRLHLRRRS